MRKIAIEKSGSPAWTRYLLRDDQGQYWTGDGWSVDRRSALLHADWNVVSHEYRRLEEQQWSALQASDYEGVVTVRVWGGQGVTAGVLQDWLHKAVAIMLDHAAHGTGPVADSLARIDIDWTKLNEVEAKEQP